MRNWNSASVAHVERTNRALREKAQRLLRVARCNVEIYSTKAKIRRRTIASAHSFDTKPGDFGLIISRIYRSPHTGISRVPWTKLSILPSMISWTRETGKTPLFASESLVKSDGRGLSDFATGPSPFPDTPWQEARMKKLVPPRIFFRLRAQNINRSHHSRSREYHAPCRSHIITPLASLPGRFALASCQNHPNQVRPSITSN